MYDSRDVARCRWEHKRRKGLSRLDRSTSEHYESFQQFSTILIRLTRTTSPLPTTPTSGFTTTSPFRNKSTGIPSYCPWRWERASRRRPIRHGRLSPWHTCCVRKIMRFHLHSRSRCATTLGKRVASWRRRSVVQDTLRS